MSFTKLVEQGLSAVRGGEFWRIARWWWINNETPLVVDESTPPDWIDASADSVVLRIGDEYHTALRCDADADPVTVSPPAPADAVEFSLIDMRDVARATITAHFTTVEGETVDRSVEFTDGDFNDLNVLPVRFSAPDRYDELRVELDVDYSQGAALGRWLDAVFNRLTGRIQAKDGGQAWISPPRPAGGALSDQPPVFLVSVDALRYDHLDRLEDVLDALGPDAVVPTEPRTQGHWTPSSHASMLTGAHPGEHNYVGWRSGGPNHKIRSDYPTLAELLTDRGYKCSAVVSHGRLLPEFGFGRGFDRYEFQNMVSWLDRPKDAGTVVDTLLRWIDRDTATRSGGLFYFAHLFDPHYPYLPPLPMDSTDIDLAAIDEYRDDRTGDHVELIKQYYSRSVEYTAAQLERLVDGLKRQGIFDDALIVITGDHGEEFLDEGSAFHDYLHDVVLRPGMVVKPPSGSELPVPDECDLIDLLPTVATLVGTPVPDHCTGTAWQRSRDRAGEPRITERIHADEYDLSVEIDGAKAIFTFESNYPYRPQREQVLAGPIDREFYSLAKLRRGDDSQATFDRTTRNRLERAARRFLSDDRGRRDGTDADQPGTALSRATEEQLTKLGYKS